VIRVVVSVAVILQVRAFARLRVRDVWIFKRLMRGIITDSTAAIVYQKQSFILATIYDNFDKLFSHICDRPAYCFKRQIRVFGWLILAVDTGEVR